MTRGTLYAGTSGFAYPAWAPRFYPAGLRADQLLPAYAARLPACELNSSFYRWPSADRISAWAAATPPGFRFCIKAQRASAPRALGPGVAGPLEVIHRLAAPLAAFDGRLGAVLFRVPPGIPRSDARLGAVLAAWPADVPLAVELQDEAWLTDGSIALLREHRVALCATELPEDPEPPTIRVTAPFLYLRLRRASYTAGEIAAWAARLAPFLDDGLDVYAFFRHDETGGATELARALLASSGGSGTRGR